MGNFNSCCGHHIPGLIYIRGMLENIQRNTCEVETVAPWGWDRKRRTDSSLQEGKERIGKARWEQEGKEKDKRKGQVVEEDRGRRGGVTGIPADMADSSFCLHLSFPVTVPSSCFAGWKTGGTSYRHTDRQTDTQTDRHTHYHSKAWRMFFSLHIKHICLYKI